MNYLYGLLEPGHGVETGVLSTLEGVTGPLDVIDLPVARLLCGPAGSEDLLPRRRHLLAHARVLEAMAALGAVLPMRFGMRADLGTIEPVLAAQAAQVAAQFDALRGQAEFGIRVSFPREAALSATVAQDPRLAAEHARLAKLAATGRREAADFGRVLADRLDRRRAAAQRDLLAALAAEFTAYIPRAPEDDVQALAIDALVPESRCAGLAARIEAAARASAFAPGAEPQIRMVGPGPAYSFVRLTLETERRAA